MTERKENSSAQSPAQKLFSALSDTRNTVSTLEDRVRNLEAGLSELRGYISSQFVELYSQMEAAREMLEETTSFVEEMKRIENDDFFHEGLAVDVFDLDREVPIDENIEPPELGDSHEPLPSEEEDEEYEGEEDEVGDAEVGVIDLLDLGLL